MSADPKNPKEDSGDKGGADLVWMKVLEPEALPEGRVTPVTCEHPDGLPDAFPGASSAPSTTAARIKGGPLGEGSIENGLVALPVAWLGLRPAQRQGAGFDDGVRPSRSRYGRTGSMSASSPSR